MTEITSNRSKLQRETTDYDQTIKTGVLTAIIVKRDMKVANLIAWGRVKLRILYHLCFQKLGKLPISRSYEGNFSNFSKQK